MILINLNDLNIYKYLDGLKKEAIETGKKEEAENHVDEWMTKVYGKYWKELMK